MAEDPRSSFKSLPEAEAQRLLARAAELDAQGGALVPLERLRLAAQEAGLSPSSFDAALAELRSATPATAPVAERSWPSLARYVAAVLGTGVILVTGATVLNDSSAAWLVRKLLDPVAMGLGAALAMRLRVRPLALLLGGMAVATGAEFAMDMWVGQPAVRGGGAHFALFIAGIGGVLLGSLLRRAPRPSSAQGDEVTERDRTAASRDSWFAAAVASPGR